MKLLPLSDLHLEIMEDGYNLNIPATEADMLLFLGDIAPGVKGMMWAIEQCSRLGVRGIYIPGNHEYYQKNFATMDSYLREMAKGSPVTFLNCDELKLDQVRFLGCTLWTDFCAFGNQADNLKAVGHKLSDYHVIEVDPPASPMGKGRKLTPEDVLQTHLQHKAWLLSRLEEPFDGKTILLTHHGISALCQNPKYSPDQISTCFWSDLEHLFEDKIDLALFGHTHANIDRVSRYGFRIASNQMGYQRRLSAPTECPDFSFNKIIDTEEL